MTSISRRGRPPKSSRTSIAPPRVAVGSYYDTVELIQHNKIEPGMFKRLQESFGEGRGALGEDIVRDEYLSPTGYKIHTLALHRPTRATVHFLNELLQHGQTISAVHVALDILVESLEIAMAWRDFLERHLITNPKAPMAPVVEESITYYNFFRVAGERFALYSDEPARLKEGLMCCHLEARVIGPKALRAAHLATPSAMIQANHRRFWNERLDLRRPPPFERIARASNKASNSRQASALGDEANRQRARELLAASQNPRGGVVAQTLLANMRAAQGLYSTKPIRHFQKQRHDWLLPARWNVQWDPETWAIA